MNAVSQWWIGGLRTRKAKVMSSILMGGSNGENEISSIKSLGPSLRLDSSPINRFLFLIIFSRKTSL